MCINKVSFEFIFCLQNGKVDVYGLHKAERIMSCGEGQMVIDAKSPQVSAPFQENKSMHLHKHNV